MAVIKKVANGEYYLFRRRGGTSKGSKEKGPRSCNYLLLEKTFLGEIIVPEELQGKRVRFKVELIEEVDKVEKEQSSVQ